MHKLDEIYKTIPLDKIPWNIETPPKALVELVTSKIINPCKTIDIGCGAGNYACYLASLGFDITGVDLSNEAIKLAKARSKKKGLKARFLSVDMLGDRIEINETFDFAYDWEVLHHIFPQHRKKYIENVHKLLNPQGKYLSVCFSIKDDQFGGIGKFRATQLGTTLYFSSEDELNDLFQPYFNIIELKTIDISGKYGKHVAIYGLMEKQ